MVWLGQVERTGSNVFLYQVWHLNVLLDPHLRLELSLRCFTKRQDRASRQSPACGDRASFHRSNNTLPQGQRRTPSMRKTDKGVPSTSVARQSRERADVATAEKDVTTLDRPR